MGSTMSRSDLTLVDVPATPKLTPRQQQALDYLRQSGTDGLTPVLLGAMIHQSTGTHPVGARCDFCATAGHGLLRALRRKGVARQRRVDGRTFWQATEYGVSDAK